MGTALAVPLIGTVGEVVTTAAVAAGKSALKSVTKSIFHATSPALVTKVRQTADEEADKIVGHADEATKITVKAAARQVANAAMLAAVNVSEGESKEEAAEAGADTSANAAKGTFKQKVKDIMLKLKSHTKNEVTEDKEIFTVETQKFQNYKHFDGFLNLFRPFVQTFQAAEDTLAVANGKPHPKLSKYNQVVVNLEKRVSELKENLQRDVHLKVNLNNRDIAAAETDCDVLESMMLPLISGIGNLKRLSDDVATKNAGRKPISDAEISSMRRALVKINTVLGLLTGYIAAKKTNEGASLFPFEINSDDIFENQECLQF